MVGSLTSRSIAVQVALYTVIAHTLDGYGTAPHLEVLVATDAVAHSLSDVQRQVFRRDVVAAFDTMLGIPNNVERTFALQLQLSLTIDAGLLRSVASIG